MKETNISQLCRLAVSKLGAVVFRNNTGQAWMGNKVVRNKDGSITMHEPRPVTFGLCTGSSDLIGWTEDGKFLAIEVKRPGKNPTPEQANFLDAVLKAGGVAGVARSPEDVREILNK